jgi:hypothetical protein
MRSQSWDRCCRTRCRCSSTLAGVLWRAPLRVAEPADQLVAALEALDATLGLLLVVEGVLEGGAEVADGG